MTPVGASAHARTSANNASEERPVDSCRSHQSTVDPALDDPASRASALAERTVLADLEAGCAAPVGALAEVVDGDEGEELWLRAVALSPDGMLSVRRSATGSPTDPIGLGHALAGEMVADGASKLLGDPP